ncbi:MAG: hypothetical protein NUV73_03765 [Candidatus Daviesbacteria bacterium]|nr:hypothetical protein [Candidatus Daviesbacteria bacterium]
MTAKNGVEQENPFLPQNGVDLPPDLVVWQDIRWLYGKFPTAESLDRVIALRAINDNLAKEGLQADLLIGGSLALGQSNKESDVDVFGVVTTERGICLRDITREYETRLTQLLGHEVYFPDDNTIWAHIINPQDAMRYLTNDYFIRLTNANWIRNMKDQLQTIHYLHYMCLGIGTNRMELMETIEEQKTQNSDLKQVLNTGSSLSHFSEFFNKSFQKYEERLAQHPSFLSLAYSEKESLIEYINERQRQYNFYIKNPKFCIWSGEQRDPVNQLSSLEK